MDTKKLKAIGLSYFRAALAAVAALYMAGVTEPDQLLYAFIAAIIGPAAKALDKSAKDFGLGSAVTDVIKKAEASVLEAVKPKAKAKPKAKKAGGGATPTNKAL